MALYHSARGSVDYTIVGSPTIVDGVASGFSSSNYLCTTTTLQANQDNLYIKIKLRTPTSFAEGTTNIVYFGNILTNNNCIRMYTSQSYGTYFVVFNINMFTGQNLLSVNSWYTIETIVREGSLVFNLYDNNNIKIGTRTSTISTLQLDGIGYFGGKYHNCIASIDLNETYIKVNGQPWFGVCPVEVKKHQIMGPVGYTVSGSPSTENGVLKNVSRTNRVYTSLSLPNFETLEVLIKAKKETSWTGRVLCLCGFGSYNSQRRITTNEQTGENQGTRLFFNAAGIIISIDNSKFDVTQYAPLGYYTRLRVTKNTEDYTYELGLSADKESWVTASANYEDNICTGQVYFLQNASGVYAADEMSLDETYIKVNGKLWYWQPRETEKIVVNGVQVWQKSS